MKNKKYLLLTVLLVSTALSLFLLIEYPIRRQDESKTQEKPMIIATLFPQYDFTKQIVRDRADVQLLLPPGAESHTYEPSPADIIKISKADMFVYTGRYMEHWAERIISSVKGEKMITVDVSKGIKLIRHKDEDHADTHHHVLDPHIWTDPNNASVMTDNILSALCDAYPANAEYFRKNAADFNSELQKLDSNFRDAVSSGKRNKIVFGGSNAFAYFLERYGLESLSAIDTCSTQADPGVKRITEIISEVKKEKIPVVFYGEMVAPKIAKTISAETGTRLLPLNSCHNLSAEDLKKGRTYVYIMRKNLANLKEGLK
ncbi:MAG: zinc ABC transporter substrate-binding protein [Synergistaceae bacterium]|nr:zinc ABC transporter substrate-binding protein [Synergistaceae bacterium]